MWQVMLCSSLMGFLLRAASYLRIFAEGRPVVINVFVNSSKCIHLSKLFVDISATAAAFFGTMFH